MLKRAWRSRPWQGGTRRPTIRRLTLALLVVAAMGALTGFFMRGEGDLFLKIHRSVEIFGKVYREIALNYVDSIDPERFMRAGIDGMLKTLDPYTAYLGEKESDEIDLVTTGKYAGVGITIGLRDGIITVINPIEGFSAAKQGIQSGDRLLEIDGTSVQSMSLEDVRLLVRGAPGTTVRMKIEREGEPNPLEFVLIREEIPVRNVSYVGYAADGIGYVKLDRFSRTAGDDIRNAIKELRETGTLRALVLDLRDNPGGLLDIAVDVAAKFIPESSLVVSTRGRHPDSERKYFSVEKPMLLDAPLAVLVNRGSASASEIVAGAIQDLDRGIIVGTRTFGKGLVQTISRLSEHSSLKITSGRYYTPSGRSIQEIDYFHRSKDGVFTAKPDSLRQEFRTAHNRRVFEGGGIMPDTLVPDEQPSKLLEALNRKAMVFKYANYLASKHTSIPDNFEVTDEVLKDFEGFLKERGFHYEEEAEVKLRELRTLAEKGRYGPAMSEGIDRLAKIVEMEKARALQRHDGELRKVLKLEIIARLRGERAAIEASFVHDRQLKTAIDLLRNRPVYGQILNGKSQ